MKLDTELIWLKREKALSRLVEARLTSVQFILNYLILGFDEKGALTTLVWPEIYSEGKKIVFGDHGYRDRICSLIENIVKSVGIDSNETISIYFDNSAELLIPLKSYTVAGERAILTGPNHYLFVF